MCPRVLLARRLYHAKQFAKALEQYELCLKARPDDVAALNNTALCFIKLREWEAARAACDRCAISVCET